MSLWLFIVFFCNYVFLTNSMKKTVFKKKRERIFKPHYIIILNNKSWLNYPYLSVSIELYL